MKLSNNSKNKPEEKPRLKNSITLFDELQHVKYELECVVIKKIKEHIEFSSSLDTSEYVHFGDKNQEVFINKFLMEYIEKWKVDFQNFNNIGISFDLPLKDFRNAEEKHKLLIQNAQKFFGLSSDLFSRFCLLKFAKFSFSYLEHPNAVTIEYSQKSDCIHCVEEDCELSVQFTPGGGRRNLKVLKNNFSPKGSPIWDFAIKHPEKLVEWMMASL